MTKEEFKVELLHFTNMVIIYKQEYDNGDEESYVDTEKEMRNSLNKLTDHFFPPAQELLKEMQKSFPPVTAAPPSLPKDTIPVTPYDQTR